MRMVEQLTAHAAEVRREADIARAQAATLRQESLEQRLAAAEVRRGEAEVRRREAEQRRQETNRRLEALFATRLGSGATFSPESSTGWIRRTRSVGRNNEGSRRGSFSACLHGIR